MGWFADFAMTHLLTSFLTAPDFIAYNCRHRDRLSLKLARRVWGVREAGWTIREPEVMEALEGEGVIPIFEKFVPAARAEERKAP